MQTASAQLLFFGHVLITCCCIATSTDTRSCNAASCDEDMPKICLRLLAVYILLIK